MTITKTRRTCAGEQISSIVQAGSTCNSQDIFAVRRTHNEVPGRGVSACMHQSCIQRQHIVIQLLCRTMSAALAT